MCHTKRGQRRKIETYRVIVGFKKTPICFKPLITILKINFNKDMINDINPYKNGAHFLTVSPQRHSWSGSWLYTKKL